MRLGARIFLVYFFFVGLSAYFVLNTVMEEIRPGVRQSTEETLVDTANLLAEILRDDMRSGTLDQERWLATLRAYGQRRPAASIWGISKAGVSHRIYVTDRNGIVVLDSAEQAVGQDYSRWNDVYLTLRGQYGARSTPETLGDDSSSIMYVAAPIVDAGKIIGVVSVAKPNRSLQPYIDRSQRRLGALGGALIALGLLAGALMSWWLSHSLQQLTRYAHAVSAGQRVQAPKFRSSELAQLSNALASMREQLEGKAYVERYVQTLTHELKSPLAAIRGAAELLRDDMTAAQRLRFIDNIDTESLRLQQLIERLLNLALVEQRQQLEERTAIALAPLIDELVQAQAARIEKRALRIESDIAPDIVVPGERFLLRQALANLLDNALDFTPDAGLIRFAARRDDNGIALSISNDGPAIPDFALPRLTERFYSLPRPQSGRKSTGLGLSFVQEVMELHGGELVIGNTATGVTAQLRLPA